MKMSKRIFLKNLSLLSVGQAFIPFTQADTAFQPARRGGETICMENIIIAIAKVMGLPAFKHAITDKQKNSYPLNCTEDYFLHATAVTPLTQH